MAYVYFIILFLRKYPLPLIFFATWPIVAFAALRGSSGKDTELYLLRFTGMKEDWSDWSLFNEPILNSLIYFSKNILNSSHELFFILHAALTCFLFACIVKNYDRTRVYLLTIGPMFLIDGLTNGMRITLAYHFFIVAILYRRKFLIGAVLLSHITGLFMFGFKAMLDSEKLTIYRKLLILFIFFILALFISNYLDRILLLMPRIASKLDKYSDMVLPNKYSGIIDIFTMVSIFILSIWCHAKSRINLFLGVLVGLLIGCLFYFSIQNSLAFIRVGKLFIVALCLSDFATKATKKIPIYSLLVIGAIYSLNFLRQVIFGNGFLPYPGAIT